MTQEYDELMEDIKRDKQRRQEREALTKGLRSQYDAACNAYVEQLLKDWELDGYYGDWVGDEVGGTYMYADTTFLDMSDIIYCVEQEVKHEEYLEWLDYCSEAAEFGLTQPNFPSWHRGCPRTDAATFEHLHALKDDLMQAIEDEKERMKQGVGAAIESPDNGQSAGDDDSQPEPPAEHPGEVVITTAPPTFDNNPY